MYYCAFGLRTRSFPGQAERNQSSARVWVVRSTVIDVQRKRVASHPEGRNNAKAARTVLAVSMFGPFLGTSQTRIFPASIGKFTCTSAYRDNQF